MTHVAQCQGATFFKTEVREQTTENRWQK